VIKRLIIPALALTVLTACGDTEPVDPCEVNPTHVNILGQCVEADGEPCDSDPCDAESDWEWNNPSQRPARPGEKTQKPKVPTTKNTRRK
jgi:hypothetical protein